MYQLRNLHNASDHVLKGGSMEEEDFIKKLILLLFSIAILSIVTTEVKSQTIKLTHEVDPFQSHFL